MKQRAYEALALGGILLLTALLGACQSAQAEKGPVPVKVAAVEMNSARSETRYSATIIPRTEVELAFKVGGYVDSLQRVRGVDGKTRELHLSFPILVYNFTKYPQTCKAFTAFLLEPAQFNPWMEAAQGYLSHFLKTYDANPIWTAEPKNTPGIQLGSLASAVGVLPR